MVDTQRKGEPLAPRTDKVEDLSIPAREVTLLVESQSRLFCVVSLMYFFGLVVGMIVLLEIGLAQLGTTMFGIILAAWISGPTTVFLLILFRTYRPLAEISKWLDERFRESDE
jgi:hypothetical protein